MRLRNILAPVLVLAFAFAIAIPGQTTESPSDKDEKKKALEELVLKTLDQTIADVPGLRLAQNRAVLLAICADLYWKFDEKRARELFRDSANDLIAANADVERETVAQAMDEGMVLDSIAGLMDQSDQRGDILRLAAKRDGDLALEMLYQTRSAKLADAMSKAAAATGDTKLGYDVLGAVTGQAKVAQENALEQQLQLLAAGEDPEKVAKSLKDNLAKGANAGMLSQLQKLFEKDPKKAAELAADVLKKAGDANIAGNQQDLMTALNFLQYSTRPAPPAAAADGRSKAFAFPEAGLRDLANKVLNALLQPSKSMITQMAAGQAIPVLEKYVPERIGLLKQKDAEYKKSLPSEMRGAMNLGKMYDPNTPAEDVLAQISKATNDNDKRQLYPILTQKISQITDEARAKRLIEQIPDDKTRATAQEKFDANRINEAISAGKVDEARRLINTLTNRHTRLQRLVALSTAVQKKGTEKDIELAQSLMKDARSLSSDYPEDEDDLADIMQLVSGYAAVDADTAFRLLEPVVTEFNDIVQASAVLSKYNKRDRNFKNGELVMKVNGAPGGIIMFRYVPQLQRLGKADLDRAVSLADRFTRNDARSLVKLYVLQGFLKEDPKPKPALVPVKTPNF